MPVKYNGLPRMTWDEFKAAMEAKGVTGNTVVRYMDIGVIQDTKDLTIKFDNTENSVTVE